MLTAFHPMTEITTAEAAEMLGGVHSMTELKIWQSPCGDHENVRGGAERFILETMGAERTARFAKPFDGRFWFHDSAWIYRITCCGGTWEVFRTGEQSARGKSYSRARRGSTR